MVKNLFLVEAYAMQRKRMISLPTVHLIKVIYLQKLKWRDRSNIPKMEEQNRGISKGFYRTSMEDKKR